jgi:NAD-dependent dihydropyrimidine dehydrogenase PreA subunit
MSENIAVILSEPRPGAAEQQELVDFVSNALMSRRRIDLTMIPHLYDLEPDGPTMDFLREIEGPMVVVSWLYPRAAFWTLKTAGIAGRMGNTQTDEDDGQRPVWCLGMHPRVDPKAILDDVDRLLASDNREPLVLASEPIEPVYRTEGTRERWYPVIDRDRCSGCLECLNFCLFGVYGMDSNDDILIEQPDACRAGCPACSRICPEGAIMFPQHADPAISGDAKASLEGLKLDLSQLFSGADHGAVALAERDRALSQAKTEQKAAGGDQLDDLVDELDEMDF